MELCSLPAIFLRTNYGGSNEDNGDLLQKIPCIYCYTQCPQPCSRSPGTCLHWKLPPGRGCWWEKQNLALVGRPLLRKSLIQLSAQGWGCTSLLVIFWAEATQPSKRVYTKGDLLDCCYLSTCGKPLLIHTSTGDPPTRAGSFGSVSCGVTAPSLWVLVCARFCLCPPRLESLFPPSHVEVVINSCWLSKSDSLGILSPFIEPPSWEA